MLWLFPLLFVQVSGWIWPVTTENITSLFGQRRDPQTHQHRFHGGLDIDSTYGAVVVAVADGKVVLARFDKGLGRTVRIQHADGLQTVYAHLSQVLVFKGMIIKQGQALGRVGNSGKSTGTHLHFGVIRDGKSVDPLELLVP